MNATNAQLEKAVLNLPAAERAALALAVWKSIEDDAQFSGDPAFDPDGVKLALERDAEIESGASIPLSHEEFRKLTGGPGNEG